MRYSTNINTSERYEIPSDLDDSVRIRDFLHKNRGKRVIVVQGLGFVGAVMALVCANAFTEEYAVIGVDLADEHSFWKIRSLNDGLFPLVADDPNIPLFFEKSIEKGNFIATYDTAAYKHADIVIVDINLDVQKTSTQDGSLVDYDVDLGGFKKAIRTIGQNCKDEVLILIETTVPPGTTEFVARPILEEELNLRELSIKRYKLGHSYERVMPGPDYISSIREFPRVYSGVNEGSADAVQEFLETIIDISQCDLTRLEHTNATEMCKVLENSYRAMNISFAIEWSRFAEEAGVNLYAMVDAIRVRKTHANLMYPGIGVGGYCLTKDPLLASWAMKAHFKSDSNLNMSVNSVSMNDQMPRFAFERLEESFGSTQGLSIALLGVSYRGNVGDTRFSPVETVARLMQSKGAKLVFHDPYVRYWHEMDVHVEKDLDTVLNADIDIILIATGHREYTQDDVVAKLFKLKPCIIYDTIGLLTDAQISLLREKHEIGVLGRGDL